MIKKLIVFITVALILGLTTGFETEPPVKYLSWYFTGFTIFILIAIVFYLFLRTKKYGRILFYITLGLSFYSLGIYLYTHAMDTSDPGHIVHFLDSTRWGKTVIRGVVVADREDRGTYTYLKVKPYEAQMSPPDGEFRKVTKGYILVKLRPTLTHYFDFDYADKIEVKGAFLPFPSDTNPGTLDLRSFYQHQDIWGVVDVKYDEQIKLIGKEFPNKIVQLAYNIKDKMLLVFKKTMRYPESAFLGGVTLGLRSGLPYEIQEQFRRTGISHVLAVSGLHVGFIAVLFLAIFGILKLPNKIIAPLVIFALILFTIITGAKPATVRAAIMFSLLLIINNWFKGKLASDLIVSLALTGLIYLIFFNPLMLVEASFVMSYTALLSIALFGTPLTNLLKKYVKGYVFIAFILHWVLFTIILVTPSLYHFVFGNLKIALLYLLFVILTLRLARKLSIRKPEFQFGIASLPSFFSDFMGMQFGITLGNVLPISAIYFQRFAIAGIFANWIAIPLIGIIVQLGIIAGIVGMVSTKIALAINAGNYLFSKFFLFMANVFSTYFPYPVVPRPTLWQLAIYYSIISIGIVWYDPVSEFIKSTYYKIKLLWEKYELRNRIIALATSIAVIILTGFSYVVESFIPEERVKVTFIDTRALGKFGGGDAYFVQFPEGKNILINGGPAFFVFKEIGFKDFFYLGMGVGKTAISPMLTSQRITSLDGVIIQNLNPEQLGGLVYIIQNFGIKRIYSVYPLKKLQNKIPRDIKWWSYGEEGFFNRYIHYLKEHQSSQLSSADRVTLKEYISDADISPKKKRMLYSALLKADIPSSACEEMVQVIKSIREKRKKAEEKYIKLIAQTLGEKSIIEAMEEENLSRSEMAKEVCRMIGKIIQVADLKDIEVIQVKEGDELTFGTKAKIKILNPPKILKTDNIFDNSMAFLIEYQGKKIFIPGYISKERLDYITKKYAKLISNSDVIEVPMYGKKEFNTYNFIKLISPKYAVCHYYYKKGRYFDSETYLNYHCRGIKFYRTDKDGAVIVTIKNRNLKVKNWAEKDKLRLQGQKKYIAERKIKNKKKVFEFIALDIGAGSAYYIKTPDDKHYLIGGGRYGDEIKASNPGKWIILPFLKQRGVDTLDGVFLINTRSENIGGLITPLKYIKCKKVYTTGIPGFTKEYDLLGSVIISKKIPEVSLRAGKTLNLGKDVTLKVLHPSTAYKGKGSTKKNSLVLKIIYKKMSFLVTGDITAKSWGDKVAPAPGTPEYNLLHSKYKKELKSVLTTVPDEGSKFSSSMPFVKAISPQIAIISVQRFSRYNPSDDAISKYREVGASIYRTDEDGTIYVYTDGNKVEINTER